MLKRLVIKNWAIIEDMDINFHEGLTVLTGETGAGKSLVIDSISLLSGDRAQSEMIRQGESKATVTGYFDNIKDNTKLILNKYDIPLEDDELIIYRSVSLNKNTIKVNDVNLTLNQLKEITATLIDIHNQFDMIKLFNAENYLNIVDSFKRGLIEEYLAKYRLSLENFKKEKAEYLSLIDKINKYEENKENFEYDLKELKLLNLQENEEESLKEKINLLKHFEEIHSLLASSKDLMNKNSLDDIYEIKNNIKTLASFQGEYQELHDSLSNLYFELEAIFDEIKNKAKHLDYQTGELDELIERESEINRLKKKHHKSVNELIAYQKELENILASSEDFSNLIREQKEKLALKYNETYERAKDLTLLRNKIARTLEKDLEKTLEELLLTVKFKVEIISKEKEDDFNGNIFLENGIDEINFLIETNIGEGLKPLNKVISGGEASRIMLAIKTLFIKANKTPLLIFDEADSGISGEVASKVSHKIYELSLTSQVLVITHLPQLASLATRHIKVSKKTQNGRTTTLIKELNLEERIYEVASLISNGKVSKAQLDYAEEMITSNKR